MRRFTKNSFLYDFAPGLVKEWHPSANGMLTPRIVKIAYHGKVWWICGQSHEWQATIKSRLNDANCPFCVKDGKTVNLQENPKSQDLKARAAKDRSALQTPFTAFESDESDDNLGHDFRKNRRFTIRTTAVLENRISGHWLYTNVKNISAGGMCFESAAPVKPGTQIIIKLDRPLHTLNRKTFNCIVRWCRTLEDEDKTFSAYTIGARYI